MSLDRVGEADERGGPGKPRAICCVATNRASRSISFRDSRTSCYGSFDASAPEFGAGKARKTMLWATISLGTFALTLVTLASH